MNYNDDEHEIYDGDGMIMVMEADDNGEIIMMMNAKLWCDDGSKIVMMEVEW